MSERERQENVRTNFVVALENSQMFIATKQTPSQEKPPSKWQESLGHFYSYFHLPRASLTAQIREKSAYNAGDPGSTLGQEDPMEKGMATHSSTLAWKTPWTEEPGGLLSMGLQRVRHDWATYTFFHLSIPAQQQPHCQFLPWTRSRADLI